MSKLTVVFIIPTECVTREDTLSINLLKNKGISYSICPYNEIQKGIIVEGNFHTILECFYVLKDDIIQEVKGVLDVRNKETFNRHIMSLYIPKSLVSMLIGKGGIGIENIRSIAYSKVVINPNDLTFENMSLLTFEGDKMGIPQAFYIVFNRILILNPRLSWITPNPHRMSSLTDSIQHVSHLSKTDEYSLAFMRALNPNVASFAFDNESEDDHNLEAFLTFRLDAKKAGAIIGTGGSVISEIRHATDTQIYLSRETDLFSCRHVEILGRLPNIKQAANSIIDIISKE